MTLEQDFETVREFLNGPLDGWEALDRIQADFDVMAEERSAYKSYKNAAAEVERLRAELDLVEKDNARMTTEYLAARAEVERLRAALEQQVAYMHKHGGSCPLQDIARQALSQQ